MPSVELKHEISPEDMEKFLKFRKSFEGKEKSLTPEMISWITHVANTYSFRVIRKTFKVFP